MVEREKDDMAQSIGLGMTRTTKTSLKKSGSL
jgi:hypothetical protein